jgi:hypothetical protein
MYTQPYQNTVNFLANNAPALPVIAGKTTNFFTWAEDNAALLEFIYSCGYERALEDLVEAVKGVQEFEEEQEDEDD